MIAARARTCKINVIKRTADPLAKDRAFSMAPGVNTTATDTPIAINWKIMAFPTVEACAGRSLKRKIAQPLSTIENPIAAMNPLNIHAAGSESNWVNNGVKSVASVNKMAKIK